MKTNTGPHIAGLYPMFTLSILSTILSGCITVKSPSLEDAAKNLEQTGKHIEDGLKGIDPVGINKLLTENSKLRTDNDGLLRENQQIRATLNQKFGGRYRVCYRLTNPPECTVDVNATLVALSPKTDPQYPFVKVSGQSGEQCSQVPASVVEKYDELRLYFKVYCFGSGPQNNPNSEVRIEQSADGVNWNPLYTNSCTVRGKDCGEQTYTLKLSMLTPR